MTTRLLSRALRRRFGRPGGRRRCGPAPRTRRICGRYPTRSTLRRRSSSCCSTGCSRARCTTRSPRPSTGWASCRPELGRAGVDDDARRLLGRARAPSSSSSASTRCIDELPSAPRRSCSSDCTKVHAAIARALLPGDACRSSGACDVMSLATAGSALHDVRLRRRRARVLQRGAHLAARHAEPVHARAPGRRPSRGEPVPLPRLLGQPRARVRSPRPASRAHRGRDLAWSRPSDRSPDARRDHHLGRASTRPGLTDRLVRVPRGRRR